MGEAEATAKELLFDGRRPIGDFVVRDVGVGSEIGVDVRGDGDSFLSPVVNITADYDCFLGRIGTVDLLLPLGVAPFVGRFGDGCIPDGVEVVVSVEIFHFDAIAAEVSCVTHV